MKREAVILSGGFGTRLQSVIQDIPKPMAPVNDRPFLSYLLDQLCKYNFDRVILASGYRHEVIESWFGSSYKSLELYYSVEKEPLGTGGAILQALGLVKSDNFFVLNGDTFFDVDYNSMEEKFIKDKGSNMILALKKLPDFDRYGAVSVNDEKITSFSEKKFCREGLINGGVYLVSRNWLKSKSPSGKFSFEKDILEKFVDDEILRYYISDGYFIDIGIPEDYERASADLPLLFS